MAAKKSNKTTTIEDNISPMGKRLLFLEEPKTIKNIIVGLALFCLVLFLLDFIIHRHGYFEIEHWYGFYGLAGFCAFTFIIFAVKGLRKLIWRPENYYGDKAVDSEIYPPEGLDIKERGDA